MYLGIDFGTTNTAVALADDAGDLCTAVFANGEATFRSILCFVAPTAPGSTEVTVSAGPEALSTYLDYGAEARLIQSIKTFLASRTFEQTMIFGRWFTLEALVSTILRHLETACRPSLGVLPKTVVAGRPVQFAGDSPDEDLAVRRLRGAFEMAGYERIELAYEPLAAAYFYARRLEQPETCLIADFGGGTSDFSVVRFTPDAQGLRTVPLGRAGVGVAGDSFDYRIVQQVICPRLGLGSCYRSFGKRLEVPRRYYAQFERWHYLSMLKEPRLLREMRQIQRTSEQPEQVGNLIHMIENELGFHLYQAVNRAKAALSREFATEFRFHHPPLDIRCTIERKDFEHWIKDDLAAIANTLERALVSADVVANGISRIFMTGGTSLVPAVRQLFIDRFGADRLVHGDEFHSVAAGLALIHRAKSIGAS